MNVVSEVASKDLCISCRACESICPHHIITFKPVDGLFHPFIDASKCTNCGLCTKVCPSFGNDLKDISPETLFAGKSECSYTAHYNDDAIRMNSASGGLVTGLIISLLETGLYKKAAVVVYDKHSQQAEYVITDKVETIMRAAKSKYVPVSTAKILEYIKDGVEDSLIVVATPCQILAIKTFCKLKRIKLDQFLFLGLFCEQSFNYKVYDYYASIYGDYDILHFRSKYKKGWPGHTVLVRNNRHQIIDRRIRMSLKPYFKNNRCRHCFDKLNSQADISLGDCYVDGVTVSKGFSSMIVRTKQGGEAIKAVQDKLTLSSSSFDDIKRSQYIENLIINYSRAMQFNSQMYENVPALQQISIDASNEQREYSLLRMGAMAVSKDDHLDIKKRAKRKPFVIRAFNRIRRILLP